MNTLEKANQIRPKARRKEINVQVEINYIKIGKTIKQINKIKYWLFENNFFLLKSFSYTDKTMKRFKLLNSRMKEGALHCLKK